MASLLQARANRLKQLIACVVATHLYGLLRGFRSALALHPFKPLQIACDSGLHTWSPAGSKQVAARAETCLTAWCPHADVDPVNVKVSQEPGSRVHACCVVSSGELICVAGESSVQVYRLQLHCPAADQRAASSRDGHANAQRRESERIALGTRYASVADAVNTKPTVQESVQSRLTLQLLGQLTAAQSEAFSALHVNTSGTCLLAVNECDGAFAWSLAPEAMQQHLQDDKQALHVR